MEEKLMRIKGMVCRRCIATVKDIFMEEGFNVSKINLGEVWYTPEQANVSLDTIRYKLMEEGFEALDDRQSRIIAKVKDLVEEHLSGPEHHDHNFSQMVTESLYMDYDSVSALFMSTEGVTLGKYLIGRRIEKAKQLLQNSKLSFTDIAFRLGDSSVHHFSSQFKNVTGMAPSVYKEISKINK